ncbi:MAG: V-type ATP synthase subunit D [Ruminococcus sp.]|jgi:V/A-type H+/Na+-transporting ATPase subunit D|nr:V-type ATP synthase subunit D [Oscillospiraceae bacterium]MDD6270486.1 V-type ATP synthase subunit D [Ruminococcus sp.]MDD7344380.1 V-type ATP synthase subunit D [Ruminococcus sp.]MDY6059543.1 V-type ATP synthase subunit D [Candidatus Fimenecus sp.]
MAQIFPTKANLMATQKSLSLAKLGYELMDRKRNILVREMMQLVDEAKEVESTINEAYKKAYASLQKANITLGRCSDYARTVPLDETLKVDYKSVMGVEIPQITLGEQDMKNYYGFDTTNSYLDEAYFNFNEAKKLSVKLVETQTSIYRLADAIKKTQKRANALNNIMIPKFTQTVKFISEALDEKEREDFTRLKVVKSTKEKAKNK